VLSCIVSFADLDTIVKVVGPVLDACYPAAIVIAMYYCLCRNNASQANLRAAKWSFIVTFVISVIELVSRYSGMFGLGWSWAEKLYSSLPLSAYSLAWLPVCIIVYAAVRLLPKKA
jgi:branched-subunit amino acid permease